MSSAIQSFSLSHSGSAIRYDRKPRGAQAT